MTDNTTIRQVSFATHRYTSINPLLHQQRVNGGYPKGKERWVSPRVWNQFHPTPGISTGMNIPALHRVIAFPASYPPHRAWRFWLLWVGFTVLGSGLAVVITDLFSPVAGQVFNPYVIGLSVGMLQGMVMRLGVSGTVRWTLATILGVVLSSMVRPFVAFHTSLITSGAVGGLLIGGIQGMVFYTQIPGMAWWVLIKTLSGGISWGLGWSILTQVDKWIGHTLTGKVLTSSVAIALIWGISAAMTGVVMYNLLARRHRPH